MEFEKVEHIETDQDWQNGHTTYWFLVNEISWGVRHKDTEIWLLNDEGESVDSCNDHDNLLSFLQPEVVKVMAKEYE